MKNIRYTLGKPTMGKNPTISEDYAFLFPSPKCNANTKKVVLIVELLLTIWPAQLLQGLLLPLLCSNIHSLALSQPWNYTIIP